MSDKPTRGEAAPAYVELRGTIFPALAPFATALERLEYAWSTLGVRLEYARRLAMAAIAVKQFEFANDRWPRDLS